MVLLFIIVTSVYVAANEDDFVLIAIDIVVDVVVCAILGCLLTSHLA
jgi:hypothetical protein